MVENNDKPVVCQIVADFIKSNEKYLSEFLNAVTDSDKKIVVRDMTIAAFSKYGRGEGRVPIATTAKGNLILGFRKDKSGKESESPSLSKKCTPTPYIWHTSLFTKQFASDLARDIDYELLLQYVGGVSAKLPSPLKDFMDVNYTGMCTVNPSYRRERYNLILSVKEYEELPSAETLDYDSIAGLNLTVLTEMMLRMAISQENIRGDKTVLKKSELDANPLIRTAAREYLLGLVCKEINDQREAAKTEAKKGKK